MNIISINKSCIIRLSRYKNALKKLKVMGFIRVFSDNLADAVGATPSLVRKDFSLFGIKGNKKGGYQVDELIERLNRILGTERPQQVVVVGAGNIGTALVNYPGFARDDIQIAALFDIDPKKQNVDAAIPTLPMERLGDFVKEHNISIGILAVPDIAAQQVLELMLAAGIKGALNFAPLRLRGHDHCVINSVNLVAELENVIYFVNAGRRP